MIETHARLVEYTCWFSAFVMHAFAAFVFSAI